MIRNINANPILWTVFSIFIMMVGAVALGLILHDSVRKCWDEPYFLGILTREKCQDVPVFEWEFIVVAVVEWIGSGVLFLAKRALSRAQISPALSQAKTSIKLLRVKISITFLRVQTSIKIVTTFCWLHISSGVAFFIIHIVRWFIL